jgi:hypothetical protein
MTSKTEENLEAIEEHLGSTRRAHVKPGKSCIIYKESSPT